MFVVNEREFANYREAEIDCGEHGIPCDEIIEEAE